MRNWLKVGLIVALALTLGVGGVFGAKAVLAQTATATPVAVKGGGLYLRGTLTAATASELTVDTGSGIWTVQLTSDTLINLKGKTSALFSDLELNAAVNVQGEFVSANTLKATTVAQGGLAALREFIADRLNGQGAMGRGRGMDGERGIGMLGSLTNTITGTVVSTTTTSITLKTADAAQVTVAVDANTEYKVPGVRTATLNDLTADMLVAVQPIDASATTPATLVCAVGDRGLGDMGNMGPGGRGMVPGGRGVRTGGRNDFPSSGVRGTVAAINGATMTITTDQGDVTVNTDSNTIFRLSDKTSASLADIVVGDKVIVSGRVAPTTPIDADGVAVIK